MKKSALWSSYKEQKRGENCYEKKHKEVASPRAVHPGWCVDGLCVLHFGGLFYGGLRDYLQSIYLHGVYGAHGLAFVRYTGNGVQGNMQYMISPLKGIFTFISH